MNLKFKSDLFSKNSIRKNKIIINDEKKEILNILNSFFKIFNINKISKIKKIDALGISSNNYYFNYKNKNYVLKKYINRDKKSLEKIANIMDWLKSKKLPIQKPIRTNKNKFTLQKNKKNWRLVEYIEGKTFSGSIKQFQDTSKIIGKLSKILNKYPKKKLIEHKYFSKQDFKIIIFMNKNNNKLDKYFGKTYSLLLNKHWKYFLNCWNKLKSFKSDFGPKQLIHNDLHPHNLIIRNEKLKGILDWEACLLMPSGISIAYAGLKICKQTLIYNRKISPHLIGDEYKKIMIRFSCLDENVVNRFYELSQIEVLRRLCMIFKSAILNNDKRWNKIIPIQLGHLYETKELFNKNEK